ncbi:related to UGA4-GABA permease-also involved in delta-aminolevulinate transport [Armillaria ostoyae]|uniref:Related to UGA4-GABA permease-also involved in delta-aminolevulinate transport n=1 Tax=Armillaria ostoyae TaxID=47428 RepID=A0A284RXN7_ARMOS|nr:related to UGA4-GABA permease-also involved in delta-aminolevulinate transport [Armillaria ostoyae]
MSSKDAVNAADEARLAALGYKQEFKRAFTPLEARLIHLFSRTSVLTNLIVGFWNRVLDHRSGALNIVGSFLRDSQRRRARHGLGVGRCGYFHTMCCAGNGRISQFRSYFWRIVLLDLLILVTPLAQSALLDTNLDMNTIGSIAGVASINWGCAVQVMAAVKIGSHNQSFEPTNAQLFGVYVAISLTHVVGCCLGTTVLARLQSVYVALNVLLCFGIIIALPVVTPSEFKNTAHFALGEFVNLNGWTDGFAFILSFLAPLWTIGSFDSSVHISEEASNATTVVPWAIVLAVGIAGVLGWAINMTLAFCMGQDLQAIYNSAQPMAQILFNGFGQKGTLGIWAIIVLVQYMMGSSILLAASRQTYAFSRDRALPFSNWLYRMNSYTETPVNTVIFDAGFAILLGLLSFAGENAINAVFSISVISLYVAYSIPIAARFIGQNDFKPGPFHLGIFSFPIALIAVLFMAFTSVVFMFPTTPQTTVQDMNYSVVVLGGVTIFSLIWYYFPKYGGIYWFTGPIPTLDPMSPVSEDMSKKEVANIVAELVVE